MATSPGQVVYRAEMFELIQYTSGVQMFVVSWRNPDPEQGQCCMSMSKAQLQRRLTCTQVASKPRGYP